jgi:hypothetical protein
VMACARCVAVRTSLSLKLVSVVNFAGALPSFTDWAR